MADRFFGGHVVVVAFAVGRWRRAGDLAEAFDEIVGVKDADVFGDLLYGEVGGSKHPLGFLDAQITEIGIWCPAGLFFEFVDQAGD